MSRLFLLFCRYYTIRYRERNRKWIYQTCPTSDTVIDNLKPNTHYEFGVRPNKDDRSGLWSKPVIHSTNIGGMHANQSNPKQSYPNPDHKCYLSQPQLPKCPIIYLPALACLIYIKKKKLGIFLLRRDIIPSKQPTRTVLTPQTTADPLNAGRTSAGDTEWPWSMCWEFKTSEALRSIIFIFLLLSFRQKHAQSLQAESDQARGRSCICSECQGMCLFL